MKSPALRAFVVTAGFSAAGVYALLFRAPLAPELLPQIIFFVTLLVNTFFSVRFYARIQPKDSSQMIIDVLLVVSYIALALSIGRAIEFSIAALILFGLAPMKYVLMLGKVPHRALLRRKIRIDTSGTILCVFLLAATLAGYGFAGMWVTTMIFLAANIYLLKFKPMYQLS